MQQEMQYADPPGMPEDERMDPAELKVIREFLGLSGAALANILGVSDRTIRHWEEGRYPIPDGVRVTIEALEERTAAEVGSHVSTFHQAPLGSRVVRTYRTDEEFRTAHPDLAGMTAGWHRAVAARVAQEVPALAITYADGSAAGGNHGV